MQHELVHYVVNKHTGERVTKFYSKRGLANNALKKLDEHHEAVSMVCVTPAESLWVRIGKGFGGLTPRESSAYLVGKDDYQCCLILEDNNLNKIHLETFEIIRSGYENQNSSLQRLDVLVQ